jgi:ADP-heptose:LPS heptosyltransferase
MTLLGTRGPWRRIAVLRPGRIGDYLCATPALRALRRAVPGAQLHYIGLPLVADLVAGNRSIDRFVAFPGFPYIAEQFFAPDRALAWLAAAQRERYDLVVQLYGSGVYANPVALLMGGRCCAGFVRTADGAGLLDAAIPLPDSGPEVDRVLALVRHLGAPPAGRGYELELSADGRAGADAALAGLPRPVIGLHSGARDAARQLPVELLTGVAAALGASAVVLGGPDERGPAEAVRAELRAAGLGCRNLAGAVPLRVAAAVVDRLDALVTTDSGPAHLAYARGTPSVTVFRASDPARWGPPEPGPHVLVDARRGPGPRVDDLVAAAGALVG